MKDCIYLEVTPDRSPFSQQPRVSDQRVGKKPSRSLSLLSIIDDERRFSPLQFLEAQMGARSVASSLTHQHIISEQNMGRKESSRHVKTPSILPERWLAVDRLYWPRWFAWRYGWGPQLGQVSAIGSFWLSWRWYSQCTESISETILCSYWNIFLQDDPILD